MRSAGEVTCGALGVEGQFVSHFLPQPPVVTATAVTEQELAVPVHVSATDMLADPAVDQAGHNRRHADRCLATKPQQPAE